MEKINFEFDFSSKWFQTPGYLFCKVPDCVKEETEQLLQEVEEGKHEVEDFRSRLAGHLQKETSLPILPKLRYLVESLAYEYDKIFLNGKTAVHHFYTKEKFIEGWEYKLDSLWVNYAKKHDFNPLHNHSGLYSFVIWVKIPYDLEKELSVYPANENQTSLFSFRYTDSLGEICTDTINLDKFSEWNMVFFPAKLHHSVNPFYTSDGTRISISGNVFSYLKNEK
jgi:hypothetical protein